MLFNQNAQSGDAFDFQYCFFIFSVSLPANKRVHDILKTVTSETCNYRAQWNVANDVIAGVTTLDPTRNLRVPVSKCSRREAVGDGRLNRCVVTCIKRSKTKAANDIYSS